MSTLVTSEAIREIDYDVTSHTLRLRFKDGDWYSYLGIPEHVHRAFLQAESHGRYFQQHIRDRFRYRKGR